MTKVFLTSQLLWCCGVLEVSENGLGDPYRLTPQEFSANLLYNRPRLPVVFQHSKLAELLPTRPHKRQVEYFSPTEAVLWPYSLWPARHQELPKILSTSPPLDSLGWTYHNGSFVSKLHRNGHYDGSIRYAVSLQDTPKGSVCVLSADQLRVVGNHFYDTTKWRVVRSWESGVTNNQLLMFQRL